VLEAAGIPRDKADVALIALDKLDKIGRDGVAKEFNERGISSEAGETLLSFFAELNSLNTQPTLLRVKVRDRKNEAMNAAILGRLVEFVGTHEAGAKELMTPEIVNYSGAMEFPGGQDRSQPRARSVLLHRSISEIAVADLRAALVAGTLR